MFRMNLLREKHWYVASERVGKILLVVAGCGRISPAQLSSVDVHVLQQSPILDYERPPSISMPSSRPGGGWITRSVCSKIHV
jgi:hypothetical protein